MNVRFYLKQPNANRQSVIFATISYNNTRFKYYLLEKIHPKDWNFKSQRVKNHADHIDSVEFNYRLIFIAGKIAETFYRFQNMNSGKEPGSEVFKKLMDEVFDRKRNLKINEVQNMSA